MMSHDKNNDYFFQHPDDFIFGEIPEFGVFQLSITQAAIFIAKLGCLEGVLEIELPKELYGIDFFDKKLSKFVGNETKKLELYFCSAIKDKTLEVSKLALDVSGDINKEQTFIDVFKLIDWLEKRGIYLLDSDYYITYQETEYQIYELTWKTILKERHRIYGQKGDELFSQSCSQDTKIRFLEDEILALKASHNSEGTQPNNSRGRRTKYDWHGTIYPEIMNYIYEGGDISNASIMAENIYEVYSQKHGEYKTPDIETLRKIAIAPIIRRFKIGNNSA